MLPLSIVIIFANRKTVAFKHITHFSREHTEVFNVPCVWKFLNFNLYSKQCMLHKSSTVSDTLCHCILAHSELMLMKYRPTKSEIDETSNEKSGTNIWKFSNINSRTRTHARTHTHPFNGTLSRTTRVSWYQKGKNQSGFYWSKRQWVAVASAGPYARLHLAPGI